MRAEGCFAVVVRIVDGEMGLDVLDGLRQVELKPVTLGYVNALGSRARVVELAVVDTVETVHGDDLANDVFGVVDGNHLPGEHKLPLRVNWALKTTCEVRYPGLLDAGADAGAVHAPVEGESLSVPSECRRVVLNGEHERDLERSLATDGILPLGVSVCAALLRKDVQCASVNEDATKRRCDDSPTESCLL